MRRLVQWYFPHATRKWPNCRGVDFQQTVFPHLRSDGGHAAVLRDLRAWFVARPLGGLVFGHYGDKIGRKTMVCSSWVRQRLPLACCRAMRRLASGRPKVRRYSGVSLGYNLASIFAGAFSPLIATWLMTKYKPATRPISLYMGADQSQFDSHLGVREHCSNVKGGILRLVATYQGKGERPRIDFDMENSVGAAAEAPRAAAFAGCRSSASYQLH